MPLDPDGLMAYVEPDEVGIPTVRVIRLVSLQTAGYVGNSRPYRARERRPTQAGGPSGCSSHVGGCSLVHDSAMMVQDSSSLRVSSNASAPQWLRSSPT